MASTHVYRAMEIAPLTVIPYKPKPQKPSNHSIRNPHPKPSVRQPSPLNISQTVDSGESSAEMPFFKSSRLEKKVGVCMAAARDAVSSGDDPESARADSTKHASTPTARYDSDNEFDDELPSLRRLLSPEYRHKLAEEGRFVQESTVGENINQALDDALFGYGSTAGSSHDEPIVLESDGRSEHEGGNLDKTHALGTVDGEPLDHNALNFDIVPAPFNPSAQTLEYSNNDGDDDGIGNNTFPRPAKRQRSASPHCEPNLCHINTTPPPHNENVESSTENANSSDSAESGQDNFLSKRRKLSDSLSGSTALNSHNGRSQHSRSSISEDDGVNGSESVSVDNLASTARTTPDVFESAFLTKSQLSPEVNETSRDWEVREVIGKEYVDGVLHYMVKWCPTLEPVHSLEHAKELVDEFEARLRALRKDKEGRVEPGLKRDGQSVMGADVSGGQQQKRPRGRPRKQK